MLDFLFLALFIALSVPGIVVVVRSLPLIRSLVLAGVKPWACDVCACFWTTALLTLALVAGRGDLGLLLVAGPAYTVALGVLRLLDTPPAAPPALSDSAPVEPSAPQEPAPPVKRRRGRPRKSEA